jgi:hypothetical protein
MFRKVLFVAIMALLALAALPTAAQDVVVEGLVNPRNLSFDADGNLYIAEAGNGGPQLTASDDPFGASSRVMKVTPDGTASVLLHGLISYRQGNSLGAHAVLAAGDSLWVLLGETADFRIPFTHALVELDNVNYRVKTFVDLLSLELNEDPDGNPNQQSNPTDFDVTPDGTVLIANAGCNCLMAWTPDAGLSVAAVWPFEGDNPVPTSVEVDADGNIYVGFLTGFPFAQGTSRVEKWANGQLVETFTGLSQVTGLAVTQDGKIYAVETGLQGLPGRVVEVTAAGPVEVATGLNAPYGIVEAPDGSLLVSVGSRGGEGGAVVRIAR